MGRVLYGMPTLIECGSLNKTIKLCKELRLDFIEINKLTHMHIHDATSYKNHLPLGKGEIDIKDKINFAIKNNCTCVLETKTVEGLRESVQYLTNYIINIEFFNSNL